MGPCLSICFNKKKEGEKRHWDWSSGIGAEDRWYLSIDTFWISQSVGFTLHWWVLKYFVLQPQQTGYQQTPCMCCRNPSGTDRKHLSFRKKALQSVSSLASLRQIVKGCFISQCLSLTSNNSANKTSFWKKNNRKTNKQKKHTQKVAKNYKSGAELLWSKIYIYRCMLDSWKDVPSRLSVWIALLHFCSVRLSMIARRTHYISYSKDKHSSIHSCTIYNCGYKEIKKAAL